MKNFIQPGRNITIASPDPVSSGDIVTVGFLVGVACGDAAIGEPLTIATEGVYELPKVAVEGFVVGSAVYGSTGQLVTSNEEAPNHVAIGIAVANAAASTATVKVRLN